MAASDFWLVSLDELKRHLIVTGNEKDDALEDLLHEVTDDWETALGRQIVTRGTLTEYHNMVTNGRALCTDELRPKQWPIISVTTVHEDSAWPRTYAAASLLVVNTDYQIVRDRRDFLRRLDREWAVSRSPRPIKLVYAAGYATTAAVPQKIKGRAKEYAALKWREIARQAQGISSQSDAMGNFTRFGAARITDEMLAAIVSEARVEFYETAEAA